jgi:preprotein translocase subunit SecG
MRGVRVLRRGTTGTTLSSAGIFPNDETIIGPVGAPILSADPARGLRERPGAARSTPFPGEPSMENVVLVILLILAIALIAVVLLQRSEGGGLGMGAGGVMTGRSQATALTKLTWWLGGAFMAAAIALTILAAQGIGTASVVDQIGADAEVTPAAPAPALPGLAGEGESLLPPPAADAPLVPRID